MRLLKIIGVIFIIYFIRRFIQMYKVMKRIQDEQESLKRTRPQYTQSTQQKSDTKVVEADFKVID